MLFFGIFLTPVFYVLLRALTGNRPLKQHGEAAERVEALTYREHLSSVIAELASALP